MLPGAFDLDEDGVGVVGKQHASDQAYHLRNNKPFNGSKGSPSCRVRRAEARHAAPCFWLQSKPARRSRQRRRTRDEENGAENPQVGLTPPAMRAESPDPPITQMSEVMT